jgi:Na+/H+-dicarboxylate symporter
VLIGLVAGFLVGLAVAHHPSFAGQMLVTVAEPTGTIFINLIRMTVIPLVVSMLVVSVGSLATGAAASALGRAGWRAAALAVILVTVAASISLAIAQPVLARLHVDASAARAIARPVTTKLELRAEPPDAPPARSALAQWFVDLVPQNVIKAAADGSMLPIILFTVLFAAALARVAEDRRATVLRVAGGVADAMQRLVAGILQLAPIGVFALAVPLASKLGLSAAAAVAAYVVLVVALTVLVGVVVLYPLGIMAGRLSPRAFIEYCAPAQAVAFASRSSLAALPAMVESAERAGLPPVASGFILPLAASMFRVGAAVAQPVGVLFLARMYGIPLSAPQLASIVFTVVLTTFAVPGIPGGSIIAMVPVLAAVNLPIEGIGILLAVDTIPDMFRTTENVTGSLTLAAVLGRGGEEARVRGGRTLRRHSY